MRPHEKKRVGFSAHVTAFIFLVFSACASTKPIPPFHPNGLPPTTCAEACQHSDEELGCQNGGACMTVCQKIENPDYSLCVSAAKNCEDVDTCGLQVP